MLGLHSVVTYMWLVSFPGDFELSGQNLSFISSSRVGSTACLTFTPVNDDYVEATEIFLFRATADNMLDTFTEDGSDFSLMIFDDDGTF